MSRVLQLLLFLVRQIFRSILDGASAITLTPLFLVIWGMVYCCFTLIKCYILRMLNMGRVDLAVCGDGTSGEFCSSIEIPGGPG